MVLRSTLGMTLAGWLIVCSALPALAQDQLPWAEDFAQACQQANSQGKLVLLHFYSDECPPCVRVERNVFSQPEVGAAVGKNYVPVKVHALKNPALATRYHVSQWPTDVFVTSAGLEVMRTISPQTPTAYINLANSVAASAGIGTGQSNLPPRDPGAVGATGVPNGPWITGATRETISQVNNQANAQAAWMTSNAAAAAQQAQQNGQQAWQTAQGQANQAMTSANQYAQQMQQQAAAAGTQAAQYGQQTAQAAAGQAQEVVNRYAQPWQAPGAAGAPAGWQPPFGAAAPGAPPMQPHPMQPAQTLAPAAAGAASPYDTNPALSPQAAAAVAANYPIAMGGFCPVTLATERKWKKGQPQFGAVHRRRTFLFTSEAEQKKFLADPDKYTPVLVGYDPVKFMQTGELIDGAAAFSLTYRKDVYLFADDASLKTFWQNPSQFTEGLRQAMLRTEGNRTLR
jgi:YHS domain-containing protein